ncbi:ubiquitin carboxyl-terminal hydrolase, putative [Eimeria brunetti]|uniref:Ubiquitin carboxyl-terminal hydrolase n=1 Tax=Eimeria brunetti TaxID=51314 RepID=U6LYW9_9EIME|nr:ubiquitin carboxyl-terminal hydrolase, putative [Eimeria brunetti]
MGTAEAAAAAAAAAASSKPPPEKTVFVEDLTPAQQAALLREKKVEPLPNGIVNLGNTCYLAAVLQLLRPAADFTDLVRNFISAGAAADAAAAAATAAAAAATARFAAAGQQGAIRRLALALKDFYNQWQQTIEPVSPFLLVPALREAYPQFSRRSTSQADSLDDAAAAAASLRKSLPYVPLNAGGASALDLLFGVQVEVISSRSRRGENRNGGEAQQSSSSSSNGNSSNGSSSSSSNTMQIEKHRKLTCFLGTPQKPVSTLEESLKFSLGDEVVQVGSSSRSSSSSSSSSGAAATAAAAAGGNAAAAAAADGEETLIRSNKIKSLSLYLILHFMRFEWKMGGTESEKAKICRSVKFGQTLDMFAFCTKELQESFKVGRAITALRRERDAAAGAAANAAAAAPAAAAGAPGAAAAAPAAANGSSSGAAGATGGSAAAGAGAAEGAADAADDAAAAAAAAAAAKREAELLLLAGKPCPTGTYQLLSVVTHQGRYADSGHYVGWGRAGGAEAPQEARKEEKKKEEQQQQQQGQQQQEEEGGAAATGPAAKKQKNVIMWRKFDDDKVTEIPWESIDLAGGRSDYHVAYLLLMKQILVIPSEEELKILAKQM